MTDRATLDQIQAVADLGGVQGATKFVVGSLSARNVPGWKELGQHKWGTVQFLIKLRTTASGISGDWLLFLSQLERLPLFSGTGNFYAWRNGVLKPFLLEQYTAWQSGGKLRTIFEHEWGGDDNE